MTRAPVKMTLENYPRDAEGMSSLELSVHGNRRHSSPHWSRLLFRLPSRIIFSLDEGLIPHMSLKTTGLFRSPPQRRIHGLCEGIGWGSVHENPNRIAPSSFPYIFPPHSANALVLSHL